MREITNTKIRKRIHKIIKIKIRIIIRKKIISLIWMNLLSVR